MPDPLSHIISLGKEELARRQHDFQEKSIGATRAYGDHAAMDDKSNVRSYRAKASISESTPSRNPAEEID